MRSIVLVFTILLSVPAFAQWKTNGVPIADEPWRKSVGTFGAMMLLSDRPDQFMSDWLKPDPPNMSTTEEAKRGEPIVAFVLFVGCTERDGTCNSVVDFKVYRPDGSEYASHAGAELWKGKPGPIGDRIQLSLANLGIEIEPNDPSGEYKIMARVTDLNAFRSVELERRFTVK